MRVLAINCGSSTLKFQLLHLEEGGTATGDSHKLAGGTVERIGGDSSLRFTAQGSDEHHEAATVRDHGHAAQLVLDWLQSLGIAAGSGLQAIGHRVVHGGDRFVEPTIIDDEVIASVEAVSRLAPLHNEPSLLAIRATRSALGPSVPMVAVFDTAFHRTIPQRASRYPIPHELATRYGIRRYGFHGIAHRYMMERHATITATPSNQTKLITLQLGNGCSATAIDRGRSVDTSMGFTPLEGLMMGTRTGDLDPSLVAFLARNESVDIEQVEDWLNTRSGLLGVSGLSRDVRELLEAEEQGNARASLALDMFCYRVRKYIGAYLAALGGADAIVFGGGIGENAPAVRARICDGLDWCGLILDRERNAVTIGSEGPISVAGAGIQGYVIPVDEAAIIAYDTIECLHHPKG